MQAIARTQQGVKFVAVLASLVLAAGVGGMLVSFAPLASAEALDVVAGAAGFVAGAVLAGAGLVSIAVLERSPQASASSGAATFAPPLAVDRWRAHFERNREYRPEPDWHAPVILSKELIGPLVHSLEQFQLGDGGGPGYLIARDQERLLAGSAGTRALVDYWFAEEREHSRLLGEAVARFGGHCIRGHWSFTAFCLTRQWFGVRFELTVLLLTEIVSTAYYRLLQRHCRDVALRSMCKLILRDEAGHVAFHRDRLARAARAGWASYGVLWAVRFRGLGLAAATMLWVNHGPALRTLGATDLEFYKEVWRELSRFIRLLRRESALSSLKDTSAREK